MPDFVSKAEERRYNHLLEQRKRDAYEIGYDDARLGKPKECPFEDVILVSAWTRGYNDGKASLLPKPHRSPF